MKSRLLGLFLFFIASAGLCAMGKTQVTEIKTQNDEWILCITDFDISTLSEGKKRIAEVFTRGLVDRLKAINYRIRVSPEYAYYEGQAWSRTLSTAAKALAAKQDERALLLYQGHAPWKYKIEAAKRDADIEKLKKALEEVENNAPAINREPVFGLTRGNLDFTFPPAPKTGDEYKFCTGQKADAIMTGSISDFHGRNYVAIKLYTVFTQSYVYEDSIIFSADDLESALDEIAGRLVVTLSQTRPAAITVRAEPEESLVLVNRSFAGRGEAALWDYPPGMVTVTASAPDYESMTVDTFLNPGELAEIDIRLAPLSYADVVITGSSAGGTLYQGALYVGETPLTLRLPLNQMDYIELETSGKKKGSAVFHTPDEAGAAHFLTLDTAAPPAKGRVDKARRSYYRAWGGTWIAGIAAWISYHTYLSHDSYARSNGIPNEMFNNNYDGWYYISMGSAAAVGAAVVYEIYRIARYVHTSNEDSIPLEKIRRDRQESKR